MIYNINYKNKSKWKKVIYWYKSLVENKVLWSGNDLYYDDLEHLHGNFNLFKYGHHGFESSTMISLNAAYNFLLKENVIDSHFLDEIISTGIDLYQSFLKTKDGKRINLKKNRLFTEANIISLFFESKYNVNIFDTSLVEFSYKERPNIFNYNSWLFENLSYYTDKAHNEINDYACLIVVNTECFVIFYDSDSRFYYLYDPQGRGLAFFNIPSELRQNFFISENSRNIEYSDMTSYVIKSKYYENIKSFIKENLPYQRNFSSYYITLKKI